MLNKLSLLVILFPVTFSASAQEVINGTLLHDGLEREYLIYLPLNYNEDSEYPLLLYFHGATQRIEEQCCYKPQTDIADSAGFIMALLQGVSQGIGPWWTVPGFYDNSVDDVGFTDAFLDTAIMNYAIDGSRVYIGGFSAGGFFAYHAACQLNDRIAAVYVSAGLMTDEVYNERSLQHPTPVLHIHGTNDNIIPYTGGPLWSVDNILNFWVDYNNCDPIPEITALPDIDSTDGSTVERIVYSGGDNGVNVEHLKVVNGGHGADFTNKDIDFFLETWNFLSRYRIITSVQPTGTTPVGFELYQNYPNPFNPTTIINYELPLAGHVTLKVYNTLGQEIRTLVNSAQPIGSHQSIWDGRDNRGKVVPSGLYFYRLQAGAVMETRKMLFTG